MNFKKHINRTLILGLTISSVYVSAHSVYALNEDTNKEVNKPTKKIELNIDEKEKKVITKKAIVRTSVLNVREEASQKSEKVGALVKNMVVTVLETKEEWTKVQYADHKEGWVNTEYIANEKATVNTKELNLRKSPSTKVDIIEVLNRDSELEILRVIEIQNKEEKTEKVWYQVKTIDEETLEKDSEKEKIGFVSSELVLTESEKIKLEEEKQAKEAEDAKKVKETSTVVSNTTSENNKKPDKENSTANLQGRTVTVNASAYSGHSITATGTVPKWGTIAVDPSVIPYGTKVYIPVFDKVFIAEDCGSAIKGYKIDIFMNSSSETKNFGRRNIEIKIMG